VIDRTKLAGKKLTLLLLGPGEEGREDAAVFAGTVREVGGALLFVRPEGESFPLEEEWLAKVEKVPAEGKEYLLGADYFLTVEAGPLGDDVDLPDWAGVEVEIALPRKR
jgi:hypothetical protein